MSLSDLIVKYGRPIISSTVNGMVRAMFYDATNADVRIYVRDCSGVIFVLNPPVFLALDAWKNPHFYADAAFNGIDNPRRLNPSNLVSEGL